MPSGSASPGGGRPMVLRPNFAAFLCAAMIAPAAYADEIDEAFVAWSGADRPGCVVGVRRGDKPEDLRAYGAADLERRVPIASDTVFESGSVAKQFTAAAVLMLAEKGQLSLADDIRKHLPEMPDYGVSITIDHLLTHTSGLRDWSDLVDFTGWPRYSRVYSNADALLIASRQRALNHAPGEKFAYTNTGYNLLAIIVERVTGQSLARFTEDQIFTPLGMTHTSWRDDFRRIVPGRAIGYVRAGDELVLGLPMENAHGSGGMLTTVRDLLTWLEALERGVLGPFVTSKLMEPVRLPYGVAAYGRGLVIGNYRGTPEIFHNGGTNGYQAWAGRYPEMGISVALLCNGRTVGPDTQVRKVVGRYVQPGSATAESAPPGPDELRIRPGLYVAKDRFEIIEIAAEGGRLQTARGNVLEPVAPGLYRLGSSELHFTRTGLERRLPDGEVRVLERETRVAPDPRHLAELANRYASDEVGGAYDLSVEHGALRLTPVNRPDAAVSLAPLMRDGFLGPGYLMRVLRDGRGRVTGLRFQTARVFALDFPVTAGERR